VFPLVAVKIDPGIGQACWSRTVSVSRFRRKFFPMNQQVTLRGFPSLGKVGILLTLLFLHGSDGVAGRVRPNAQPSTKSGLTSEPPSRQSSNSCTLNPLRAATGALLLVVFGFRSGCNFRRGWLAVQTPGVWQKEAYLNPKSRSIISKFFIHLSGQLAPRRPQ
jgi:hypothetical protein